MKNSSSLIKMFSGSFPNRMDHIESRALGPEGKVEN